MKESRDTLKRINKHQYRLQATMKHPQGQQNIHIQQTEKNSNKYRVGIEQIQKVISVKFIL